MKRKKKKITFYTAKKKKKDEEQLERRRKFHDRKQKCEFFCWMISEFLYMYICIVCTLAPSPSNNTCNFTPSAKL